MEIEEVKENIRAILKDELSGTGFSAFFFGSRVTGAAAPTSDVDVGIEGKTPLPEATLRSIRSRAEALPTLFTIDIVDFSLVSEDFRKVAREGAEKIDL